MADISWKVSAFNGLSAAELYDILALRAEVFVVEQECPYMDPDGKDLAALHITGRIEGSLALYARAFGPGDYFEDVSIGRVIVAPHHRREGLGHTLMHHATAAAERIWGGRPITISAQQHLERFYNAHGFTATGAPYLEDGIPHIRMRRG